MRQPRTKADLQPGGLHIMGLGMDDEFYSCESGAWNITKALALVTKPDRPVYGFPLRAAHDHVKHLPCEGRKLRALEATFWWERPLLFATWGEPTADGQDVVILIDGRHRLELWRRSPWKDRDVVPGFVLSRAEALECAAYFVRGNDGQMLNPTTMSVMGEPGYEATRRALAAGHS